MEGQLNDCIPVILRDLVPGYGRRWLAVFKAIDAVILKAILFPLRVNDELILSLRKSGSLSTWG